MKVQNLHTVSTHTLIFKLKCGHYLIPAGHRARTSRSQKLSSVQPGLKHINAEFRLKRFHRPITAMDSGEQKLKRSRDDDATAQKYVITKHLVRGQVMRKKKESPKKQKACLQIIMSLLAGSCSESQMMRGSGFYSSAAGTFLWEPCRTQFIQIIHAFINI